MWTRLEKAIAVVGSAAISALGLFAITRRSSRAFGDAEDDHQQHVLSVAADAFRLGDVKRGEKILEELPVEQRTIARCTRATKKRYRKGEAPNSKGRPWKESVQISTYHLYAPFVAEPMYGSTPKGHPYTDVLVNASRTTDLVDQSVTDWVTILGDLGPTKSYPENGEYRYLVSGQSASPSHTAALRRIGYDIVIPCSNVPLSGRTRRTRRRR